jgi:hypothetical protein
MGRTKDPMLAAMKVPQDFYDYLDMTGMAEIPECCGDLNEADLPVDRETGVAMSLEQFSGNYSGVVKTNGVYRQREGGAVVEFSVERQPSPEWRRHVVGSSRNTRLHQFSESEHG